MIRVLHVMRSLNAGGIGAFVMNVYRKADRKKIQFDFALTHGGKGIYGDEIESLGGEIYFLTIEGNRGIKDGIKQFVNLYRLCRKNKYDIVHCHYYFANAWFLMSAKLAKIPVRVSHCHNAGEIRNISSARKIFEAISRKLIFTQATVCLGCSEAAAEFLYGRKALESGKAKVLYNGIDYERFSMDNYDKEEIRRELDVRGDVVFVFVGRYERQKNPLFALRVFHEIHKSKSCIRLYMIGYGSLETEIRNYISRNHLQDVVIMLPQDTNVAKIQAISDVMIAPSVWEGLSIAYIEAQKMETIVVASRQIPPEVDMGYCEFLELGQEKKWANSIIRLLESSPKRELDKAKYEKFNAKSTVDELMQHYGIV